MKKRNHPVQYTFSESLERRLLLSNTWTVTSTADDGSIGTLRYYVNTSAPGDTIRFSTSVFPADAVHTITLGSQLEIAHNLSIIGSSSVAISGNNASRVFLVDAGTTVSLSSLTITKGNVSAADGGGIFNSGNLTLSSCVISNNIAFSDLSGQTGDGGGIYNAGSLTVTNSSISQNQSYSSVDGHGGGGLFNSGTASVTGSTFSGDLSLNGNGGAVATAAGASLTIASNTFTQNSAGHSGGAVYNFNGTVSSTGCSFNSNVAGSGGGGLTVEGGNVSVSLAQFTGNLAQSGGGITSDGGTLSVSQCTFSNNQARGDFGGGIYNGHNINFGPETAVLVISASSFVANTGDLGGGGIYNLSTATAINSTFSGNVGTEGGGIDNVGQFTITNCSLVANNATTSRGGGLNVAQGAVTLNNSIVAENQDTQSNQPSDVSGAVSGSNNLIGPGGAGGLVNGVGGNIVGITNPSLSALGNYGGPTPTIAALAGSPAIDAGSNALAVDAQGDPLVFDQRGLPRINNGIVDIGAYEVQSSLLVNTTVDENAGGDGKLSLREAFNIASADQGPETITIGFDPVVFTPGSLHTITLTLGQLELASRPIQTVIQGPGQTVLAISGNNLNGVLTVDVGGNAIISGVTVTGGMASTGGGITNNGLLTLDDSTVSANSATTEGGGIFNSASGTLTAEGSTLSGNVINAGSQNGGAGIYNAGTLTLDQSTVSGNNSGNTFGGGILNTGTATIVGSTVSQNTNTADQGVGIDNAGMLSIFDSTVAANMIPTGAHNGYGQGGAGIFNGSTLQLENSVVSGNNQTTNPSEGGGLYNCGAAFITNTTFSDNLATAGGGIAQPRSTGATPFTLIISQCTFSNNNAGTGGGIYNHDALTLQNSIFTGNIGGGVGAALVNEGTANAVGLLVTANGISNGLENVFGSAIENGGIMDLSASVISSNLEGYGFENQGTATITGTTIALNTSIGIDNYFNSLLRMQDCTVWHNTDLGLNDSGTATIVSSTFSGDGFDSFGWSIQTNSGNVNAGNVSIYDTVAASIHGTLDTSLAPGQLPSSYNLVGIDGSGGLVNGVNGNMVGVANPLLSALGNYGGPTETVIPLPGSPLIDAGSNVLAVDANGNPLATDQRSYPRIYNGTVDIGAVEFQPQPINGTSANDSITLKQDADQQHIDWSVNGTTGQFLISDPEGAVVNGNGGNDTITLDYTNGNPLPASLHLNGTFTINGLQGTNPLAGTTLDIGHSTVFISYSSSDPIAAIQGYLLNGYNAGAWNGTPTATTGVITSAAAQANPNHTTAIGYADSADGQGVNTTTNTIELTYTLYGDANLDHQVNSADLQILLFNLNRSGSWDQGDFNYDAHQVNSADLQALLFTLNTSLGSQATPLAVAATPATSSASSSNSQPSPHLMPAINATGSATTPSHHPQPRVAARKRR